MEVDFCILTAEQIEKWKAFNEKEYNEYLQYYDEKAGGWYELPEWMIDNIPDNGPFEFDGTVITLNPSWGTWGT